MENNEIKFAKIIEDLKYTARAQGGYILESEVAEAFEEMDLSDEQLEVVFQYLKDNKIGLDAPLEDGEALSAEDRNLLEDYRNELNELRSVSEGEKRALIMAAMANDASAAQGLIGIYLPEVLEIARLYADQGVLMEDLIGEGNLAVAEGVRMLGALESPDEADSIMTKIIMDAMEDCIKENFAEESKDKKMAVKVNKVSDEAKKLREELGRKVSVEELADSTTLSRKTIVDALELSGYKIEDIEN